MGNHCCVLPSPQGRTMDKNDPYNRPVDGAENFELPHISEREDLSNHKGTLFLTRSLSNPGNNGPIPNGHRTPSTVAENRRKTQTDGHPRPNGPLTKKFSSCSTIFIDDSTVSQPNLKSTIKCVALAVYYHVKHRDNEIRALDIFDEKLHPLTHDPVPDIYDRIDPEQRHVYKFIKTLFHAAQLTAECAIITLVYLERLLTYAEIDIYPGNWKRILLGAILLASKVWDDQAVWNVDYCQILKDVSVEDMNELERAFLELLQFNVSVPSSVYAKYYFDLRSLADANDLVLPVQPLSKRRARKLEALSRVSDDRLREQSVPERPRSRSVDTLTLATRGMAVLS